jgi:beta-RFAP synthase
MTTVRVEAPARLHMGMLDAAGDGPRRFGGLGVAVSRPAVVVEASARPVLTARSSGVAGGLGSARSTIDELTAEGPDAERALAVAQRSREALGLATGAHVRVLEAIPAHAGLGSGTKLALAVTAALAALAGESPDPAAMARTAGRGARSAVGLWTFALGGFVVEGGRRRGVEDPAPLLMRHAMPDEWRCVLVIPAAEPGLSGAPEEAAFTELRPDPARSAEIAQLVLTALLPALVERDLPEFGAALSRIQRLVGDSFAPVQGGTFHPQAGALVDALLRLGAAGAGQSSWGPAVYGVVGSEEQGRVVAGALEAELGAGGRVEVVRFDNRGARVEVA